MPSLRTANWPQNASIDVEANTGPSEGRPREVDSKAEVHGVGKCEGNCRGQEWALLSQTGGLRVEAILLL